MTCKLQGIHFIAYHKRTGKHAIATTEIVAAQTLLSQFDKKPSTIAVYKVIGQMTPPVIQDGLIVTEPQAIQELYNLYKVIKRTRLLPIEPPGSNAVA